VALWENSSQNIYVAWLDNTPYGKVTITVPKTSRATFFSVLGASIVPNSDGANYLLDIGGGPVYIILPKNVLENDDGLQ